MEVTYRIDPLTKERFIPKKSSQRFASADNRIRFNNRKASILNQERAFFDKPCKQSQIILQKLDGSKLDNIFHREFLKGMGLSLYAYNHIVEINNEKIIAYYGYALRKVPDSDNYQILKL